MIQFSSTNIVRSFLLLSILIALVLRSTVALKCLDEDEREVDWWVFYKIPRLTKGSSSGDTYVYATSRTVKVEQNWIYSPKSITTNESMIASTLNQVYLNWERFNFVQYNDEPPTKEKAKATVSSHSAHAKAVVAFDSNDGFWLTHSIPKFPPSLSEHYEYPTTGLHYGQTALCVSFEATEKKTNSILNQLLVMRPTIYAHNFVDNLAESDWSKLINEEWSDEEIQSIELNSIDGVEFESYSKSPLYEIEVYEDKITVDLKQSLNVQTWRDGSGGHLNSNCTRKFHVYNVENIRINAVDKDLITHDDNLMLEHLSKGLFDFSFDLMKKAAKNLISENYSFNWKYTVDHSKWAISVSKENPHVCIGDLNRVKSQQARGGGVICFENLDLWNIFSKSIKSFEPC